MSERLGVDEVVAAYIEAVGCRDAVRRDQLIVAAVSERFVFCSGSGESHGRDKFAAAIEAVHELVPPGAVLARTSPIEAHHGRLRFAWRFEDPISGDGFDDLPHGALLRG